MNKKEFFILFLIFSILFILPIWLVDFLPFIDLPQHLNFAHILLNYRKPEFNYNQIYTLRLFPMHNTLHLFFCYLFGLILPLEITNKIYITISILLFPLALWFLIRKLEGNEQFSLFGFLLSYNYNLFWGFMGFNVGIPLVIFLVGLEIITFKKPKKTTNFLLITILFILLFFCHSLIYIFSVFTYLLIFFFNLKRKFWHKKLMLLLPLIISFVLTFLPWQAAQFRGEGSELQEQLRQYISPSILYQNLLNLFQRIGVKSDYSLIFIFKLIFLFTIFSTFNLIRQKGIAFLFRSNFRVLSLFILITFLFYLFFPGMYTEAFFLNERFAPLLFLLFIVLLSLNFSNLNIRTFKLISILVIFFVGLNILIKFIAYEANTKDLKTTLTKLDERSKIVGLFYQRRPKPDYFGYDTYIHLPCYYQIYRHGLCGFSFAYIRYSPIVYNEPNPLPRIDEWATWNSIFPNHWTIYDYFLVCGEPRLQDEEAIKKWRLLAEKHNWRVYENVSVKEAWVDIKYWMSQRDLSNYKYLLLPPLLDKYNSNILSKPKTIDYQSATKMIMNQEIHPADFFPCLAIWLKDDHREYAQEFSAMNSGETFQVFDYLFTPVYKSNNGFLVIYDIK